MRKMFLVLLCVTALFPTLITAVSTNDIVEVARIMSSVADDPPAIDYMACLKRYAKEHDISDEGMTDILLFIAKPDSGFNECLQDNTWLRVLGVLAKSNEKKAIPLFEYYITQRLDSMTLIALYGKLTNYDERLYDYINRSYMNGYTSISEARCKILEVLLLENYRNAISIPRTVSLKMTQFLFANPDENLIEAFANDEHLCKAITSYSNSIERIKAIERMDKIPDLAQHTGGYYRNYKKYTKNEALTMMSNELARLKALPPGELIDLTSRLEAELAALTNSAQTVIAAVDGAPVAGKDDEPDDTEQKNGRGWIAIAGGAVAVLVIAGLVVRGRRDRK